jgi:hypothetical protein
MAWRPHSHARVQPANPQAWGVCDRCGLYYNLVDLVYQYQWAGPRLQNLRIRVCRRTCLDVPQQQLKPRMLPPDPLPVFDPRPDGWSIATGPAAQMGPTPLMMAVVTYVYPPPGPPANTGLWDDGGFLGLIAGSGYPTSADGLTAGAVWNNGGIVGVVPGIPPGPDFPPVYFGSITAAVLQAMGGGNLPLSGGPLGSGILWNNGGLASIS